MWFVGPLPGDAEAKLEQNFYFCPVLLLLIRKWLNGKAIVV